MQSKQRIGNEISLLTDEIADRYELVSSQDNIRRLRFIESQASACAYFMKATSDKDDDWGWFPDFLESFREDALSRYRDAREVDQRELALLMLARLRLSTTLARRLADSRRTSLFVEEDDGSDTTDEEILWVRELTVMMEEAVANHQRVEPQGHRIRSLMALAPVYLIHEMLKNAVDADDWSWIKESVYDYIESETLRYREARAAGDRDNASVMLARLRFATNLARRLEDPERQAWLARRSGGSETEH